MKNLRNYLIIFTFNLLVFYKTVLTIKFNCSVFKDTIKTQTVHQLRPSDIRVIGALGDSLTAAAGANAATSLGLLIENREISWSMGGKSTLENIVTLPNILKKFNPKLTGYSTESSFIKSILVRFKSSYGFNAAVSGQEARHLLQQAKTLINKLKASKSVDFQNDWKLITILIGGNDICDYCRDKEHHTPEAYIKNIQDALDLLHKELPKALVNLVNVLNVAEVEYLNFRKFCDSVHKLTCPCIVKNRTNKTKSEIESLFNQYSNYTEQLTLSSRYDTRDDFTVVYQPFLRDFKLPKSMEGKIERSYFAPDCFHFAAKTHGNLKSI